MMARIQAVLSMVLVLWELSLWEIGHNTASNLSRDITTVTNPQI